MVYEMFNTSDYSIGFAANLSIAKQCFVITNSQLGIPEWEETIPQRTWKCQFGQIVAQYVMTEPDHL